MHHGVEEYAKHTHKKLLIATAISVLKCKPPNISSIDFCKIIQSNLKESSSSIEVLGLFEENEMELSQSHTFCIKELSELLHSNNSNSPTKNSSYSQPPSLQTTQIFQDIRDAVCATEDKNDSIILQNLDTIQAINSVKRIMCTLYGKKSFDGIICNNKLLENTVSQSTQDSGYLSSQLSSSYTSYNRRDSGLCKLNNSLKVLVNVLINSSGKYSQGSTIIYVSEIFGRAIDILYDKNIYLPSFDYVVDVIDSIMDQILNRKQIIKITSQQKYIFTFFLLNKSILFIQHSLMQLTKELKLMLNKLSQCGPFQALEFTEPKEIDSSFYIFHLLEGLLHQQIEIKKRNKISDEEESSNFKENPQPSQNFKEQDSFLKLTQAGNKELSKRKNDEKVLKEKYTNLLNKAILECVETYPLICFWAMNCLNLET